MNMENMKNEKGDSMKKQIITLVMGILIGAVITAAIFLIFKPKSSRSIPDFSQFNKDGETFDFSKSGRRSRNSDSTSETEDSKVEEKQDESQG